MCFLFICVVLFVCARFVCLYVCMVGKTCYLLCVRVVVTKTCFVVAVCVCGVPVCTVCVFCFVYVCTRFVCLRGAQSIRFCTCVRVCFFSACLFSYF